MARSLTHLYYFTELRTYIYMYYYSLYILLLIIIIIIIIVIAHYEYRIFIHNGRLLYLLVKFLLYSLLFLYSRIVVLQNIKLEVSSLISS